MAQRRNIRDLTDEELILELQILAHVEQQDVTRAHDESGGWDVTDAEELTRLMRMRASFVEAAYQAGTDAGIEVTPEQARATADSLMSTFLGTDLPDDPRTTLVSRAYHGRVPDPENPGRRIWVQGRGTQAGRHNVYANMQYNPFRKVAAPASQRSYDTPFVERVRLPDGRDVSHPDGRLIRVVYYPDARPGDSTFRMHGLWYTPGHAVYGQIFPPGHALGPSIYLWNQNDHQGATGRMPSDGFQGLVDGRTYLVAEWGLPDSGGWPEALYTVRRPLIHHRRYPYRLPIQGQCAALTYELAHFANHVQRDGWDEEWVRRVTALCSDEPGTAVKATVADTINAVRMALVELRFERHRRPLERELYRRESRAAEARVAQQRDEAALEAEILLHAIDDNAAGGGAGAGGAPWPPRPRGTKRQLP